MSPLKFLLIALGWALAIGLLWWLFVLQGGWEGLSGLRGMSVAVWVAVPAGLLLSYALRATRMHHELVRLRPVRWLTVLNISLVHNALVNVLPFRGGEIAYPVLLQRRLGLGLAQSVPSLLWMRLQDALVLVSLAVLLMWQAPLGWRFGLLAVGALALALLLAWLRAQLWLRAWAERSSWHRRPAQLLLSLAGVDKHSWVGWLCCAANWLLKIGVLALALQGLSGLPVMQAVGAALGGELAALLPVQGPAGLGTYEAAVWAGARWHGEVPASLPAAALAVHLLAFCMALLAGLAAALFGRTHSPPPST